MKLIRPNTIAEGVQPFTRASTATYIDRNGVLQTAAVNEPRFERGVLLVEGSATNLTLQSAVHGVGMGVTSQSDTYAGPDGSMSADGIVETAITDEHFSNDRTVSVVVGTVYTFSSLVKSLPAGAPRNFLQRVATGTNVVSYFSPSAADWVGAASNPSTGFLSRGFEALANGWFRVWMTFTAQATATTIFRHQLAIGTGTVYLGDGVSGLVFGGTQVEVGAAPTSYIPTTTTTVTRAADVPAASGLLATTATEAHPTYNSGTAYAVAARVVSGVSIYESLTAANTGNPPATSPTHWVRRGPSNAWALLDAEVSTQTTATGVLSLALAPGIFDTLAVIGVDAEAVTLTVQDGAGGPIVYQQTQSVTGADVYDWYEYFFSDPTVRRTLAVFGGLPPYASAVATLTVAGGGTVKVGGVVLGRVQAIGDTQYGAQAGITDYSRKDTDEFGTTTFVKRAMSKKLTATVQVPALDVNRVHRLLSDLRATPVLWIGSDAPEFSEPLVVYGFYRDFYLSIAYPTVGLYQLEIEGLS